MNYLNFSPFKDLDIEIHTNSNIYELHNDADFNEIIYSLENHELLLIWNYPGEWFLNDSNWLENINYLETHDLINLSKRKIALIFENVTFLKINPRDVEIPIKENKTLDEIYTYDETINKECLRFEFMSEMTITVIADSVYFDRDFK